MRGFPLAVIFTLVIASGVALLGNQLAALYRQPIVAAEPAEFPAALAGARFTVSRDKGFHLHPLSQGTLLIEQPNQALGQAQVSLCDQRASRSAESPLIPLYVGWDWSQLQTVISANLAKDLPAHFGLKNPLLDDGPGGIDVPAFTLETHPAGTSLATYDDPEGRLQLVLKDTRPLTGFSDITIDPRPNPETVPFYREAWLFWNSQGPTGPWWQALQVQRLSDSACQTFGRVRVTVHQTDADNRLRGASKTLRFYPGDGTRRTLRLPVGEYTVPAQPPALEDDRLFTAAWLVGLIRQDQDGRLEVAPRDLPRRLLYRDEHPQLLVTGPDDPWLSMPWNAEVEELHKQLHHSPTGDYVRRQVEIYNSRRLLAALRGWAENPELPMETAWQAQGPGFSLPLTEAMPLLAGRLFQELPRHWQSWQRVERWPDRADSETPVRFIRSLSVRERDTVWQVLVLGRAVQVSGATVLASEPRCLTRGNCREATAPARWLRLQPNRNSDHLTLTLRPWSASTLPGLYRHEFAHIRLQDDEPDWQPLTRTARAARGEQRAQVKVVDRQGDLLSDTSGPTAAAWEQGLAALVGVDPRHETALAGNLARLGEHGVDSVEARLTLEGRYQQLARQALGQQLLRVSNRFKGRDPYQAIRFAGFVVLDADRGEILAAASLPAVPRDAAWSDLARYDVAQPRRSPLRLWAWHHDGSGLHTPGSTFKIISALALERDAQRRPRLEPLLQGLAPTAIADHPLARAYDFGIREACYPAHSQRCRPSRYTQAQRRSTGGAVHNFAIGGVYETLVNRVAIYRDRHYGLAEALRDSLNTWFAWLVETTDTTLLDDPRAAGLPHVRALTPAALDGVRPLQEVTRELGFGKDQPLDGGLLPEGLIRPGDALLTTPSRLDPLLSRHHIRLAALGFRMQVTPLQMALVAASIATEQRITPHLLLTLNGQEAETARFTALGIATDRIRQGMKRVPEDGTAKRAFANARFDELRPYLYAKTGTADLTQRGDINNAWLVGWVEPGGIPGENRRLAFACLISHTRDPGGAVCGPVVAHWLAGLLAQPPTSREGSP